VNPNRTLEHQGIVGAGRVHYNLIEPALVEAAVRSGEGFFGLSGTGKTTLSADPERAADRRRRARLGDDGVFNFEGGCYAKVHQASPRRPSRTSSPPSASARVLENVVIDGRTRELDFDTASRYHREHPRSLPARLHPNGASRPAAAATRSTSSC
jgi:phosphoenolpyruvate carboxykinase (ATP)